MTSARKCMLLSCCRPSMGRCGIILVRVCLYGTPLSDVKPDRLRRMGLHGVTGRWQLARSPRREIPHATARAPIRAGSSSAAGTSHVVPVQETNDDGTTKRQVWLSKSTGLPVRACQRPRSTDLRPAGLNQLDGIAIKIFNECNQRRASEQYRRRSDDLRAHASESLECSDEIRCAGLKLSS